MAYLDVTYSYILDYICNIIKIHSIDMLGNHSTTALPKVKRNEEPKYKAVA
jgi:hypothetical protein